MGDYIYVTFPCMSKTPQGRLIREARRQAGMSQSALGKAVGVNKLTILRIETGKTQDPRHSTIEAIERALGVSVDELLEPAPAAKAHSRRRGKGAR